MKIDQSTGDPAKDQLIQCIADLATRAVELGYLEMGSILYVVGGTCLDGSETELMKLTTHFAQYRLIVNQSKLLNSQSDEEDQDSKS